MTRNKVHCSSCSRMISLTNHKRHEAVCDGPKVKKVRGVDYDPNAGYGSGTRVGKNQYTRAQDLGLQRPAISNETREKLRLNAKIKNELRTPNESERIRAKISESVKNKIDAGEWHVSLARKMHYTYKGIDLHGSWELAYAKYLDECNIPWERCKQVFTYQFEGKRTTLYSGLLFARNVAVH